MTALWYNMGQEGSLMSWAHIHYRREKLCKFCGAPFITTIPRQVFCCYGCKNLFHNRGGAVIYDDEDFYASCPNFKNAVPRPKPAKKTAPEPLPEVQRCPQCYCRRILTRRNGKGKAQREFWQECHYCRLCGKHAIGKIGTPWRTLIEQSIRNWNNGDYDS